MIYDPKFKHIELDIEGKAEIDQLISPYSDYEKRGFSIQADNENLPFLDSQFDLYIASLSLHLVTNPQDQLKEAYWVLQ